MQDLTGVVDGLHMRSPGCLPRYRSRRTHGCVHIKIFDAERMSGRIHAKEAEGEPDMYAAQIDGGLVGKFECLDWSFSGAAQ